MDAIIREYTAADKADIQSCIEKLQDHEANVDPLKLVVHKPGFGEKYLQYLSERYGKEGGTAFVAVSGAEVVGVVSCVILRYAPHEVLGRNSSNPYGYVTDLFVTPAFRNQDLGSKLMRRAEEYFKAKGCEYVTVGVLAPNAGPYAFYKKIGYADRYVDFIKKI